MHSHRGCGCVGARDLQAVGANPFCLLPVWELDVWEMHPSQGYFELTNTLTSRRPTPVAQGWSRGGGVSCSKFDNSRSLTLWCGVWQALYFKLREIEERGER